MGIDEKETKGHKTKQSKLALVSPLCDEEAPRTTTTPISIGERKKALGDNDEEIDLEESLDTTSPGAVAVDGIQSHHTNVPHGDQDEEDLTTIQADRVPDPIYPDHVIDTVKQEVVQTKQKRYAGLLIAATVFYGLAIAMYIVGVGMNFKGDNPWNVFAQIYAYTPAACAVFVATVLYAISMCVAPTPPEKRRIAKVGLVASISTIVLVLIAGPLLWKVRIKLGYVLAVLSFATTVVALYCTIRLLQRDSEPGRCQKLLYNQILVGFIVIWFLFLLSFGTWQYQAKLPIDDYPDCHVDYEWWIGDGGCDGLPYASEECGYDDGDCLLPGEACRFETWGNDCLSGICNATTMVCE